MTISQLPILVYHYFGHYRTAQPGMKPWDTAYITPVALLRSHCDYLRDNGYQPVSLQAVVEAFKTSQPLPAKSIVITIDDGHESVLSHAAPILAEFQFPSELFVIPERVGGIGYPDWAALKTCGALGMAVQSHGLSHRRLNRLSADEVRNELVESKRRIESACDHPVIALAAPMGRYPKGLDRQLVACGYTVGLTSTYGINAPLTSLLALERIMLKAPHDSIESLRALLDPTSSLARQMRWRNLAKRVRMALLG